MHLLFVKCHLIIFEVISTVLLVLTFVALFYFAVFYKTNSAMDNEESIKIHEISFSANFSKGAFSDVEIKIYPRLENGVKDEWRSNAFIILEKGYFNELSGGSDNFFDYTKFNEEDLYNIMLFENKTIAINFVRRLINLKTECSTFNITLFALISLFLIFLKITLLKDNYFRLKRIKSSKSDGKNETSINLLAQIHPEEYQIFINNENEQNVFYNPILSFINPINVYYYIVFHLTIILIIPYIFPSYVEFYISRFFSFMSNMPYAVYYGRTLFGNDRLKEDEKVNLYNLIIPEDSSTQTNEFIFHEFLNLQDYTPTNVNPYVINLLIMCGSIWLSQQFHPFDSQSAVKITDVNLKAGKIKKIIKIGAICAVFGVWGYFVIVGFINTLDYYYLFHKLLFTSFKKIMDLKIILYIALFYYHIYFYVIMIIYTLQTYKRNKKYVGNAKIEYKWFS